jgi:Methyltransferase domain
VRAALLEAGILPTRNDLPELLNRRGLVGTGVEIGVKRGLFSEVILRGWRGRKLISIDPWLEAPRDEYVDVSNVRQAQHERFYDETLKRLSVFGERSEIWRMTSAQGAARIEARQLDFVYLDARHDYDSVKEDLQLWFGKIRPGGVFAGHDYFDGLRPQGMFGVKSAVDEFFGERSLTVNGTYVDARFRRGSPPSWLVEIPLRR